MAAAPAGVVRPGRDRGLAERLGAAGHERALAELSEDRHVERVLDVYRELTVLPSAAHEPVRG